MISGSGPLEDYEPLSGLQPSAAPKGGLVPPLEGPIAIAAAPQEGGMGCEGGVPAACIVNSGQKLKTPKILVEGSIMMVGSGEECEPGGWVV